MVAGYTQKDPRFTEGQMTRKVLVITYYFPPRAGVGSLRLKGLAKYLPEFGWEPVILTAALPGAPEQRFRVIQTPYPGDVIAIWKKILHLQSDRGFQEQLGIPRAIRGSKRSLTNRLVVFAKEVTAYPDEHKTWYPSAVEAGQDILRREKFDALLSSSSPVTAHLVAKELKMKFHIPWVADLRDLWTQNHYYPYSPIRKIIERRLELHTLSIADALVTVSVPLAEQLGKLHQGKPIVVIPNGFDPEEIDLAPLTKEFTITYTGHLYQGKRDPAPLFRAVAELISEGKVHRSDIKIRFYGSMEYWLEQEVKHYKLEDVVSLHSYVSREEALTKQRESQLLLLLSWNDPRERGIYTGKLFEYLAARRPILAVGGPRGVVTELLQQTNTGVHVSSYAELKDVLAKFYEEYKIHGRVAYHGYEERIAQYSHYAMARRFAEILNWCVENSTTCP